MRSKRQHYNINLAIYPLLLIAHYLCEDLITVGFLKVTSRVS